MSRRTLSAVTLLPEPDSPTSPSDLAGDTVEIDAVDGLGHAGLGVEVGPQAANLEQWVASSSEPASTPSGRTLRARLRR